MYGAEDPGLDLVYVFMLMPQGKPDECRQGATSRGLPQATRPFPTIPVIPPFPPEHISRRGIFAIGPLTLIIVSADGELQASAISQMNLATLHARTQHDPHVLRHYGDMLIQFLYVH